MVSRSNTCHICLDGHVRGEVDATRCLGVPTRGLPINKEQKYRTDLKLPFSSYSVPFVSCCPYVNGKMVRLNFNWIVTTESMCRLVDGFLFNNISRIYLHSTPLMILLLNHQCKKLILKTMICSILHKKKFGLIYKT